MYTAEDSRSGVRWGHMDFNNKKIVGEVKQNVESILNCYPDLRELEYGVWSDLINKYFWPLVKDA